MQFSVSLHWGVYSVPAWSDYTGGNFAAEWFWEYAGGPAGPNDSPQGRFWQAAYPDKRRYEDFAGDFRAELYGGAAEWAALFAANHVQLAVLTSKHHDGYELWPSSQAEGWCAPDVGPGVDLVGLFMNATRAAGVRAGLYHSVFEWFNPLYRGPDPARYVQEKLIPDLHQLVALYQPDMLLMDGEWEHNSTFWTTRDFLAWLYNSSPVKDTVVVDDRWGSECRGAHGGVYICENGGFSSFCDASAVANRTSHPWLYWLVGGLT